MSRKENTKTLGGFKYFQRQAANITCRKFRQVANNGSQYKDEFYILEIVIDVGVIGTSVVPPSEVYHSGVRCVSVLGARIIIYVIQNKINDISLYIRRAKATDYKSGAFALF